MSSTEQRLREIMSQVEVAAVDSILVKLTPGYRDVFLRMLGDSHTCIKHTITFLVELGEAVEEGENAWLGLHHPGRFIGPINDAKWREVMTRAMVLGFSPYSDAPAPPKK